MATVALAGASTLGRDHAALRRSSQDAFAYGSRGDVAWGVVSDGCGSGAHSEVGAGLAAALLNAAMERFLITGISILEVPELAVSALVESLEKLGNAMNEARKLELLTDHLLATVVGFCVRGDEGAAFWCGDGAVVLGEEILVLEAENAPDYPAYRLLGRTAPVAVRPFSLGDARRVAVATDGFDCAILTGAFGRASIPLKRWMNVRSRNGHFRDDATIVTATLGD